MNSLDRELIRGVIGLLNKVQAVTAEEQRCLDEARMMLKNHFTKSG
jgi:hypothetical protein